MKTVKLNNGVGKPIFGFGVFDTNTSSFFDHRDFKLVKWLGERKMND